jgi:hypothetical protein
MRASDKCRKAGDLDGLLVLTEEINLCAKAGAFPDNDALVTHEGIRQARNVYRAAVARAKEKSFQQQKAILERHIDDLEALKKKLTIDGDIKGAVAVKEYMASVRSEIDKQAPVTVAAGPTAEEQVACPSCSGTGKKSGPCPKCSGSGNCTACDGTGLRKASLKGTADRMPCLACMKVGAGKCMQCEGKGVIPSAPCDTCSGSGKVTTSKATYLRNIGVGRSGRTDTPAWAYYARGISGDNTVQRGAEMKAAFDNGNVMSVELEKVLVRPESYRGKVCRSAVSFRYSNRTQITVSARQGSGTVEMSAYSEQEWDSLEGLGKVMKYEEQVVVFYGVLDPGRFIVFRATPARKGSDQPGLGLR